MRYAEFHSDLIAISGRRVFRDEMTDGYEEQACYAEFTRSNHNNGYNWMLQKSDLRYFGNRFGLDRMPLSSSEYLAVPLDAYSGGDILMPVVSGS